MIDVATLNRDERETLSEVFAFLGNSLLSPMSQTGAVGLDPSFWNEFPCFGKASAKEACMELEVFARAVTESEDALTHVSVEYTQLFVGPPKPAACPWESYYIAPDVTSGFGEPTFQMQRLLRENGLVVSHEDGNQLADHMGIELMLLSEMLRRETSNEKLQDYIGNHPGSWVDAFQKAVEAAAPRGYYVSLLRLVSALL